MNKIIITFALLFFLIPGLALSQAPAEDEITDSESSSKDKIDEIKDKVTTQVEKLNLVERKGLMGVVESVNENQIKINDLNDKIRIIEVDELTKYSSTENNSFGYDNIEPGTNISTLGLYNKDSEKLLARFLNEISIPVFLTGVISDVNEDDFSITLTTEDEINYIIDIETITKSFSFTDEDLENSGFSNLEVLQNAVATGFPDPDEENRISANRIIIFPDIPNNPRINIEVSSPTAESTPTPTL